MNSYKFVCEKENWAASWHDIGNYFYGERFSPDTLHLIECKKRISEQFNVGLDDVIVYRGGMALL